MLFCYTLVSGVVNCLINPSQMASGADFLHLKVDKKRMQCFIQAIAFFHFTIRILQCCNSYSFFHVSQRFFLRFLCLIYLLTCNKTVQYFLIDFYFKAVAHFLNASLIEREEIVCFHSIGHVGI